MSRGGPVRRRAREGVLGPGGARRRCRALRVPRLRGRAGTLIPSLRVLMHPGALAAARVLRVGGIGGLARDGGSSPQECGGGDGGVQDSAEHWHLRAGGCLRAPEAGVTYRVVVAGPAPLRSTAISASLPGCARARIGSRRYTVIAMITLVPQRLSCPWVCKRSGARLLAVAAARPGRCPARGRRSPSRPRLGPIEDDGPCCSQYLGPQGDRGRAGGHARGVTDPITLWPLLPALARASSRKIESPRRHAVAWGLLATEHACRCSSSVTCGAAGSSTHSARWRWRSWWRPSSRNARSLRLQRKLFTTWRIGSGETCSSSRTRPTSPRSTISGSEARRCPTRLPTRSVGRPSPSTFAR